jgi:hypothetical protein
MPVPERSAYTLELKGSKKVLLLPGGHVITVRQSGCRDFTQTIIARPGQTEILHVAMHKGVTWSDAECDRLGKDCRQPSESGSVYGRNFRGERRRIWGLGRAMLIAPGAHKIRIALPGHQTFETEINVIANQKLEIKTELAKNDSSTAISDIVGVSRFE